MIRRYDDSALQILELESADGAAIPARNSHSIVDAVINGQSEVNRCRRRVSTWGASESRTEQVWSYLALYWQTCSSETKSVAMPLDVHEILFRWGLRSPSELLARRLGTECG